MGWKVISTCNCSFSQSGVICRSTRARQKSPQNQWTKAMQPLWKNCLVYMKYKYPCQRCILSLPQTACFYLAQSNMSKWIFRVQGNVRLRHEGVVVLVWVTHKSSSGSEQEGGFDPTTQALLCWNQTWPTRLSPLNQPPPHSPARNVNCFRSRRSWTWQGVKMGHVRHSLLCGWSNCEIHSQVKCKHVGEKIQ